MKTVKIKSASGTKGNQSVATVQREDGGTIVLKGPSWEGHYENTREEYFYQPHPLSSLDAGGVRCMPLWWDRG
jgi:hypothetical protein